MNWVLIGVAVILLGYTIAGFSKGFLKVVYSLVSWIVILVSVVVVSPYIQDYIKNDTDLYNKVIVYCEETIEKEIENYKGEAVGSLTDNEIFQSITEQLPEQLVEELTAQAQELTDGFIAEQGIYGKTAVTIADLLLKGVATLAAIVIGIIASGVISMVLGVVSKLPIIGTVDHLLGLAAGAVNGLLVIWVVFYLIAVLSATPIGSDVIAQINASEYLMFLYEKNPILSIIK